jgi:hypothetical protein
MSKLDSKQKKASKLTWAELSQPLLFHGQHLSAVCFSS